MFRVKGTDMLGVVFHNPWVQAAGVLVGLIFVCLAIYLLSPVLVPLVFAFFAAYIANPAVDYFEKRRLPRGVTISVMAVTALLVLLAIPIVFIPHMIGEAEELISAATQKANTGYFAEWFNEIADRLPLDRLVLYLGLVPPDTADFDARAVLATALGDYIRTNAISLLRQIAATTQAAGLAAAQVFSSIWRSTVAFLIFVGNFAVFAFVAGYLLRDFHKVTCSVLDLVPQRHRLATIHIVDQIDDQLRGFLRGQLLVMVALGIMYAIGLSVSGTPFGVPIGLFGGLASFVPYLGLILTIIPASVLTVLAHGIDWHLIGALGTFAVAQFIEGFFLTPRIVGEKVGLNPVWVILAIMVFSGFFGFVGLLVAVPLAAVLKVLVLEAVEAYKRSDLFDGEDETGPSSAV